MGLGLMNKNAQLCILQNTIDSEGFSGRSVVVLENIRVLVEAKHGSERWANLAAFSAATDLFRFRKIPNIIVDTKHYIMFNGFKYDILSVEDVKGRNMYVEVLAKKVEASNG